MVLRNIFKKKPKEKPKERPIEKPKPVEKPGKVESPKIRKIRREKKAAGEAYRILKEPHVTEKATGLTKQNQYIFKVQGESNKPRIKKAVEDLYGVEVISVRVVKVPRRRRRLGRIEGWRKGYKKAIVRLREGQKIEVLPR